MANMLFKFRDDMLFNIHTIQPGKIVTFDQIQKKAKVQPLIKLKDTRNNIYSVDPIDNVPVVFPIVAGFELKFPLTKDDGCLLFFSELPLGNYLNIGGDLIMVDADDANKFELTDCIAIPGLYPFKKVPTPSNAIEVDENNNFIIKTDLGSITIDQTGSILLETTVGKMEIDTAGNITFNDGTEAYVLGTSHQTALLALTTAIAGITPAGSSAGNITSIQTAFATFAGTLATMLSTQIKGK